MATEVVENMKVVKRPLPVVVGDYGGEFSTTISKKLASFVLLEPSLSVPEAEGSLTNDQLRELAGHNPPPQAWFGSEEEQLF